MAIPSGSGTEVLKRYIKDGQDATESVVITGVANHIYTILSIIASNRDTGSQTFYVKVDPNASGTQVVLIRPIVPDAEVFVLNDRFVLSGTDKLIIDASGGDFDVIVSYIDQDWT